MLAQREQTYIDAEKKEPPCMACYTRVPDLSKKVISLNAEEEEIVPAARLTPIQAQWMTMLAFCKRCCHNKSELTSAHMSCLGVRNRGFQLLDLTPAQAANQTRPVRNGIEPLNSSGVPNE